MKCQGGRRQNPHGAVVQPRPGIWVNTTFLGIRTTDVRGHFRHLIIQFIDRLDLKWIQGKEAAFIIRKCVSEKSRMAFLFSASSFKEELVFSAVCLRWGICLSLIYCVKFEIVAHKSDLLHAVWKMVQRYLIRVVVSDIVVLGKGFELFFLLRKRPQLLVCSVDRIFELWLGVTVSVDQIILE